MPDAPVLGASRKVKLDESAFAARFAPALVHRGVRAQQAARRRGTAATRTRAMVSGGGAKPFRQKGTGRARAGSTRSPIWKGGGTAFGPQPRSYAFKVNRKERRAALRSALSLHAGRGSIAILHASAFQAPRTRQALDLLDDWGQARPTLVVLAPEDSHAALSFRNLARVTVLAGENVGVADLLGAASVVVSESALGALAARAVPSPATGVGPRGSRPQTATKGSLARSPAGGKQRRRASTATGPAREEGQAEPGGSS
jgi:large subunit ribosomal protein L4